MTVDLFAGASSNKVSDWQAIDWPKIRRDVRRLQLRIAKAIRAGKHGRAKALSWLLTHSLSAKLLAVKRVTENKGAKTPGVDNKLWRTDRQKYAAVQNLKRRGYRPLPLRRHYIPKKNGKLRPLSIPTLRDRAMQALHALALKPIAETVADRNSYGFREGRSCADAIGQCFCALAKSYAPAWVLEGDIKSCFDRISHKWLLANIPMDAKILRLWLAAGYWEKGRLFPTNEGTPQGGIISPLLSNLTLDGMEKAIRSRIKVRRDQVTGSSFVAIDSTVTLDDRGALFCPRTLGSVIGASIDHGGAGLEDGGPESPRYAVWRGLGVWKIIFDGQTAELRHERGMIFVAYLLMNPPVEPIHPIDLIAAIPEFYRNQVGLPPVVDPRTGTTVVTQSHARVQERSLSLDDLNAMRSLGRKQRELEAIAASSEHEAIRAEAERELEALCELRESKAGKARDGTLRAADTVKKSIKRLQGRLAAAVDSSGKPHRVLRAFAGHLRDHLLRPSRGTPGRMGCLDYRPPAGVKWVGDASRMSRGLRTAKASACR